MSRAGCPAVGNGGFHSESYGEDGDGACKYCGAKPLIRYCPLEVPPDVCQRGCGADPCDLVVGNIHEACHGTFSKTEIARGVAEFEYLIKKRIVLDDAEFDRVAAMLENPRAPNQALVDLFRGPACYACGGPLGFEPTAQPALCENCDNIP